MTLGENLADSGVIQAYRAWKANADDYVLPGLNYTSEQMFWISFGRIWASKSKAAAAVSQFVVYAISVLRCV